MFRLCRELGFPHPDYLGRWLNHRQLREWAAFESLEPFEPERSDARSGLQTYWMRAAWLENHKGTPTDYMVRFEETEDTEAAQLMREVAELFDL